MTDFGMYGSEINRDWEALSGKLVLTIDRAFISECVRVTIECKKALFETHSKTFKLTEDHEKKIPGIGLETRSIYIGKPENYNENVLFSGIVSKSLRDTLSPIVIKIENADGLVSEKEIDLNL